MKLQEILEKYQDENKKFRRKNLEDKFRPSHFDDEDWKNMLDIGVYSHSIEWLKMIHAIGNEESRKLGFLIPQFMIDDAQADDWEEVV